MPPTVDPTSNVRSHNRDRILAAFAGVAAVSRSELVERTGLSRTTVTGIVGELLDDGLVRTVNFTPPGARVAPGRRPAFLALVRSPGFGIAVDAGNEHLQVALADRSGRVLAHLATHVSVDTSAEVTVARLAAATERLVSKGSHDMRHCTGVVVGIPEPLGRDGHVGRSAIRTRWRGHRPGALLSDALGVPVRAENDANLAVVGETVFGAGRGLRDVIFTKVAHGVGSGIIANGRLVRGGNGFAGEIGHTQAREDGLVCTCGNRGCLYTLVTSQYLAQLLHAVTGEQHLDLGDLATMGRQGHVGAGRVLTDAGREVGRSLANLCNTLNPSALIVGGALAHAGHWLMTGLRESMDRYAEAQVAAGLTISSASLGERAELFGAIAMAVGIVEEDGDVPQGAPVTTAAAPPATDGQGRPTEG